MQLRAPRLVCLRAETFDRLTSSSSAAVPSVPHSPNICGSEHEPSERILVLEADLPIAGARANLPVLGLNAGAPRTDHLPQNEVWGLAWNTSDPIGFPGLAYCLGGRSVFWGGWSPRLLDSELPNSVWPQAVLDDLRPKTLPDGRKGYFRQSSDQIGVTATNDFIFGDLHHAMRKQLFDGLSRAT